MPRLPYYSFMGSLMYAMIRTCMDLSYDVSVVSLYSLHFKINVHNEKDT